MLRTRQAKVAVEVEQLDLDESLEMMNKYAGKKKPQRRVSDSSFESQKSKRKRIKPAKSSLASSD